jgi:arylsulfatase
MSSQGKWSKNRWFTAVGLVALVCAALISASPAAAADKKPNIVIIWGDDIGQSNISAYSHGLMGYQTPNIDRLAKEGMKIGRASCRERV